MTAATLRLAQLERRAATLAIFIATRRAWRARETATALAPAAKEAA